MANVRWTVSSTVVLFCLLALLPAHTEASTSSVFKALVIGTNTQAVTSSTLSWEKFSEAETHLQFAVRTFEPEPHSRETSESEQVSLASTKKLVQSSY